MVKTYKLSCTFLWHFHGLVFHNLPSWWGKKASSRPLFWFIKKAWYEMKASGLELNFNIFQKPSTCHTIKTISIKLDYWSRDVLNFNFSEEGLGLVSPPYFVYDFSRKMFLMLMPVSTIFIKFLFFHQMLTLQKLWKKLFISS